MDLELNIDEVTYLKNSLWQERETHKDFIITLQGRLVIEEDLTNRWLLEDTAKKLNAINNILNKLG